jgi:hypothetical protein
MPDAKSSVWHPTAEEADDVFDKDIPGSHEGETFDKYVKHKSFVRASLSGTGGRMGLTRDTSVCDVHRAVKICVREAGNIRPNRSRFQ